MTHCGQGYGYPAAVPAVGRRRWRFCRVCNAFRYHRDGEELVVRTTEPTRVLHELTADAVARGEELERLEVRRPTLEDVYLSLTEEDA